MLHSVFCCSFDFIIVRSPVRSEVNRHAKPKRNFIVSSVFSVFSFFAFLLSFSHSICLSNAVSCVSAKNQTALRQLQLIRFEGKSWNCRHTKSSHSGIGRIGGTWIRIVTSQSSIGLSSNSFTFSCWCWMVSVTFERKKKKTFRFVATFCLRGGRGGYYSVFWNNTISWHSPWRYALEFLNCGFFSKSQMDFLVTNVRVLLFSNGAHFAHCFGLLEMALDASSFDVVAVKLHQSGTHTHFTTGNLSHTRQTKKTTTTPTTKANCFASAFFPRARPESSREHNAMRISTFFLSRCFRCQRNSLTDLALFALSCFVCFIRAPNIPHCFNAI